MKVGFVSQPGDEINPVTLKGSLTAWTCEVTRRLARYCDVIVYAKRSQSQKRVEYCEGVRYRRITIRTLGGCRLPKLLRQFMILPVTNGLKRLFSLLERTPPFASSIFGFTYALQVALDLRAQRCDIVHVFNCSQFVPVIRVLNPKIKIILHMQCEWLTQINRAVIERRLKQVDLIIGCSEYITERIRRHFPQFAERCQTVFNGTDVSHFVGKNGAGESKQNDAKRLLFVGRVSPEKGVHVLLDAFHKVLRHCPEAQLEVVGKQRQAPFDSIIALGDDPKVSNLKSFYNGSSLDIYFSYLQERVFSLDIASHVTFSGPVPQARLIDHYRDADVFIFPSVWNEPFGMPVAEAMACEMPVVATRGGGLPEIVVEGKTGLLVERGDVTALTEAILRLLSDQDLRESMGKAGRQRVLKLFSWEQISENFLCHSKKLYKDFR